MKSVIKQVAVISIKLFLAIVLLGSAKTSMAQELRVYGNVQILGYIDHPFIGPGVGFELPVGEHFAVDADLNFGFQNVVSQKRYL